jgi:glycerophosphoryl diester phosphodiesterase
MIFKAAMSRYLALPKPRFLAHRGASANYPENTFMALAVAAQHVDYIETDVWMSRDGQVVLQHDESLHRTCGVDRRAAELTLAELQALDAGYLFSPDGGRSFPWRGEGARIITLQDALEKFPKHCFNIEIKDPAPGAVEATLAVLSNCHAEDRVMLAAEKDPIMTKIRQLAPELPTSASFGEMFAFLQWLQGGCQGPFQAAAKAFQIPDTWKGQDLSKPDFINVAHKLGVEVHYWTINDPARIRELLANGADGIVTDRPELASEFNVRKHA